MGFVILVVSTLVVVSSTLAVEDARSPSVAVSSNESRIRQKSSKLAQAYLQNRFNDISAQREATEFLWVPGILLQEILSRDAILVYPE